MSLNELFHCTYSHCSLRHLRLLRLLDILAIIVFALRPFSLPQNLVPEHSIRLATNSSSSREDPRDMRRDVATRDDRASAQRDAQGYNAYDAFADTIVQDTLAGAGLVVY